MRSEREMLDLILDTAHADDRIRAVILNGSRVNPNAPRDPFQDFDVVYLVSNIAPFRHNLEWIQRFGELMILQLPEDMQDPPPNQDERFAYLMQFTDGNRIDLTIAPLEKLAEFIQDSLTEVLLDKDGLVNILPPANDSDYLPQPPTIKAFSDCCNEFWWVCPYVAKGLWRGEILYAKNFLDHTVRAQLMKMLTWYAGMRTQFSQSPGKNGKYLQNHLEPNVWEKLLGTFSDADIEHTWSALFTTCDLFREVAIQVAEHFAFDYPHDDDQRVSAHLKHIKDLPREAREIY
jgi:aminoglycoside 6-adenylyltransferase